jgi:hypothetical protein
LIRAAAAAGTLGIQPARDDNDGNRMARLGLEPASASAPALFVLEISNRKALRRALPDAERAPAPA